MPKKLLSELKKGQMGKVSSFSENLFTEKLMEMGCLPGTTVKVVQIAPFGGPFIIELQDCNLGLRRNEASYIEVETD